MKPKTWIWIGLTFAVVLNGYIWRNDYLTAKELPAILKSIDGLSFELDERPTRSDFAPLLADTLIHGLQPVYLSAIDRRDTEAITRIEPDLKEAMNADPDSILGTYARLKIKSGSLVGKLTFCVLNNGKVVVF